MAIASLAAALRTFGKARVKPGTVVRLTRPLLICETPDEQKVWGKPKYKREDYHCECRRLRPSSRERESAGGCAAGGRQEG